jgi:hypothetical protein
LRLELLINIPLTKPLPSANKLLRMHWAQKAALTKSQRNQVTIHMLANGGLSIARSMRNALASNPSTGITCSFTRVGTKPLDSDNLQGAFKAHRDSVAEQVGLDDGSPRWTWKYAQESGAPGYRIHLEVTAGLLTQSEVQRG